jgi:hypothetical protein
VGRTAKTNGQNVFQAEQAPDDDGAIGPRAGAGDDQPVAARLYRIAVRPSAVIRVSMYSVSRVNSPASAM